MSIIQVSNERNELLMKRKIFNIAVICALISSIMLSMVGFKNSCDEMCDNIIRIRIIANSDSKEDQELKIKIRDNVLITSKLMYEEADTYEDAVTVTNENIEKLLKVAQNTISANGFSYNVSLDFRDEFFETRKYDEFTLPSGVYKTAVFTVGEGNGKNWWCVIFPQVCVGACAGSLEDSVSKGSADYAYNADSYVIKFKTVEIFEKVKKYLVL